VPLTPQAHCMTNPMSPAPRDLPRPQAVSLPGHSSHRDTRQNSTLTYKLVVDTTHNHRDAAQLHAASNILLPANQSCLETVCRITAHPSSPLYDRSRVSSTTKSAQASGNVPARSLSHRDSSLKLGPSLDQESGSVPAAAAAAHQLS
jgi:hypothetical protein